jgi:hypothetical protein
MKIAVVQVALSLIAAIISSADTASARSALNCVTKQVVIVDAPSGSRAAQSDEHLSFWIDEARKTITFVDGVPLSVRRFDAQWISATYEDVSYEFDRGSERLSYAGASAKDGTATIVIGSGRCAGAANPRVD